MEDTTNPESEVETADTTETEAVNNDQADELEDDQQEAVEDDSEELDIDGERYQLPKKLKDKFMMHADYTRKTQEVAEVRKAVEAERAQVHQERQAHFTELKAHAEILSIDQQLEQYKQLNWDEITDEDPVRAMKLERQMRELQGQREIAVTGIHQRQHEQALKQQQEIAKQLEEGRAILQREIKGWSPELAQKISEYGETAGGYSKEEVASVVDPRAIKILHKAYLYDQLVKKQSQPSKPSLEAKPVTKVKGGLSAASDFSPGMSDAEYDRWRARQKKRS